MSYILIKYLHIVAAAIIVGVYSNQALLAASSSKILSDSNYLRFYRWQLRFVAIPTLAIQFASGLYMANIAQYSLGEAWLSSTMTIIVILLAMACLELRSIKRKLRPIRFLSAISLLIALIAIFVMVTKPEF